VGARDRQAAGMTAAEPAAAAEALRISTRAAKGLPPELTSDEPFHLAAGLIRESEEVRRLPIALQESA
jgi:hypothetical protein